MNKKLILLPVLALLLTGCGGQGGKTSSQTSSTGGNSSVTSSINVPVTGVTLNKTTLDLEVEEYATLVATVAPVDATDKSVTWSVDKPEVATVVNGRVTGVSAGTAVVTATASGFTATCTVNVFTIFYGTEDNPLTVDKAYDLVKNNVDSGKFTAEQVWVEGVVYQSSYYSSGKTYNGYLQASDEDHGGDYGVQLYGVAMDETITGDFTAADALVGYTLKIHGYLQNYNNMTSVEFNKCKPAGSEETIVPEIKVATAPSATPTGVRIINQVPETGIDASATFLLKARLIPLNAAGTITWESSDTTTATVDSTGLVTGVKAGNANIVAKVGSYTSDPVSVKINAKAYYLKANFANKSASNSQYYNTWTYDDFTLYCGANNNGGWDYVKFGQKSKTNQDCFAMPTNAVDSAITKIKVSFKAGSLPNASTGKSSVVWGVKVYSTAPTHDTEKDTWEFPATADDTVTGTAITAKLTADVEYELVPNSGASWATGKYYKVFFTTTESNGTNGVIWVNSITFIA